MKRITRGADSLEAYYRNLSVSIWQGSLSYSSIPPYHPHISYPEYDLEDLSPYPNPAYEGVRFCLKTLGLDEVNYGTSPWNPLCEIVKTGDTVVIKPNFVSDKHYEDGNIYSVITHPSVIRAIVDYLYKALEGNGRIIIADAPQMDCNFQKLLQKTGLASIQELYFSRYGFELEVLDLRDFWFDGDLSQDIASIVNRHALDGDPLGSVLVNLGKNSAFCGLRNLNKIYGADYNRNETISHHHDDVHEYSVSKTIMNSDVVISLPKLKVHKKVGVTLNTKGLVGIVTNKNCLVHYTIGTPDEGGDQFPSDVLSSKERILIKARKILSDMLLAKKIPKLDRAFESMLKFYRIFFKPWYGTVAYEKAILDNGNWYGNDSAWRMAVDLMHIIFFADSEGGLHDVPQRKIFSIVDGIIGGENNGPLAPDSKFSGVIAAGFNPLATDIACTAIMGFDYRKLKWVEHLLRYQLYTDANRINILGERKFSSALTKQGQYLNFKPHPGWQGYLEL